MKAKNKKAKKNFFKENQKIFVISGIVILVIIIAAAIAVAVINAKKDEETAKIEQEKNTALIEKFKNIYLLTTNKFTVEQGECVWKQIEALGNSSDILSAAKEYDEKGAISSDSVFAKKIYSSIEKIYQQCGIETADAAKNVDNITDVIDVTQSGIGTMSSDTFTLKRGLANITITGSENISVELKSVKGDYTDCYYSSYSSSRYPAVGTFNKKCTLGYSGDYYLDVHVSNYGGGSENWTINIRQE